MKFKLEPYNRDISEEDLINDLKEVAQQLGKNTLTQAQYKSSGRFSPATVTKYLGGWLKALDRAGLNRSRKYRISEEDWFENLAEVWRKLGRQPHPSDMQKPLSKYSYAGYKRRFGRWRRALELFIEYVNREEVHNTESVDLKSNASKGHRTSRNPSLRLRFRVMRRDDFKCTACGRSPATCPGLELVIDHITAWSKGGETVIDNLQTLCSDCNTGKSNLAFRKPCK